MIKSLLRRFVAASAGALVLVGTSATVASASPVWQTNNVTDLALVDELALIPLGIALGIAALVWTVLTARERAAVTVASRTSDKG